MTGYRAGNVCPVGATGATSVRDSFTGGRGGLRYDTVRERGPRHRDRTRDSSCARASGVRVTAGFSPPRSPEPASSWTAPTTTSSPSRRTTTPTGVPGAGGGHSSSRHGDSGRVRARDSSCAGGDSAVAGTGPSRPPVGGGPRPKGRGNRRRTGTDNVGSSGGRLGYRAGVVTCVGSGRPLFGDGRGPTRLPPVSGGGPPRRGLGSSPRYLLVLPGSHCGGQVVEG